MQVLKPHQMVVIFMAATAGTLLTYFMFNLVQALCCGVVVGIFTYSFLVSLEEKKLPASQSPASQAPISESSNNPPTNKPPGSLPPDSKP
jgi:hypothetical protein